MLTNTATPEQMKKANEMVALARAGIAKDQPGMTKAIYEATFVPTTQVQTLSMTERGVLMWNPLFVLTRISIKHVQALIAHEIWHWLRKHHKRGQLVQALNPTIAQLELNMAGDREINDDLFAAGMSFGSDLDDKCLVPKQIEAKDGLTMEEYVVAQREFAAKQQPPPPPPTPPAADDSTDDEEQDSAPSDDSDDSEDEASGADDDADGADSDAGGSGGDASDKEDDANASADSKCCSGGFGTGQCGSAAGAPVEAEADLTPDLGKDEEVADRMREQVAQAILEDAKQGRGNYAGDVLRWAEKTGTKPKVDWRKTLPRVVRESLNTTAGSGMNSYRVLSRRQAGLGYGNGRPVLPGSRQPLPTVQVWVDTSGSMGSAQMSEMLNEVGGLLKHVPGKVTFGVCDAKVHAVAQVRTVEECRKLLKGGGGTDFRPLFDTAAKLTPRPDTVVVLTDGIATIPPEQPKGMNVVWVLLGSYHAKTMPWGKVIDTDPT
jgi:predicted metal-dependent peptidase